MERWAANTLRTLGIVVTCAVVLIGSLLLLLLSLCAYGGGFEGGSQKHPDQAALYLAGAIAVIAVGILIIAKLAKGIARSSTDAQIAAALGTTTAAILTSAPANFVPIHLSPAGKKSVHNLVFAIVAGIAAGCAMWLFNMRLFWRNPAWGQMNAHRWGFLVWPFILSYAPYLILVFALLKRPDRRAFTFAVALPAVSILISLFTTPFFGALYLRYYTEHPETIIVAILPLLLDVVVLVLAYKAIQQVGLHPQISSLVIAGVAIFVYFAFVRVATPILFRFGRFR